MLARASERCPVIGPGYPGTWVGWRGKRMRPTTGCSYSSNSPTATAWGSRVSSSGERIMAKGMRCASNRDVASAMVRLAARA